MSRLALRCAFLAWTDLRSRALLAGLLLGAVVHALGSQRGADDAFALAMALVMVTSGAAAFVLHALATSAASGAAAGRAQRVRGWLITLGIGVVAGVQALALLGG